MRVRVRVRVRARARARVRVGILRKVPASWSAWQCVRMTCVILRDAMPFSRR